MKDTTLALLSMVLPVIVMSCGPDDPGDASATPCGDGACDTEDVDTPQCGDGVCSVGETSCPADCHQSGTLPNGSVCTKSSDCLSGSCAANGSGALNCYGDAVLGENCTVTQDCAAAVCLGGVCIDPSTLLLNGNVCEEASECASGDCSASVSGVSYCYGSAGLGEECNITQDCAGGVCRDSLCVDPSVCTSDAECALNAVCSDDACVQVCGSNAIAVEDSCICAPGFVWASSDPSDSNCVPAVSTTYPPGCHIFADNSEATYLGGVGGCYETDSICNQYGRFGSRYSTSSIFNEYGQFGSPYGPYSAFNQYSVSPPLLFCDGVLTGCVTTNSYAACTGSRIDPRTLCTCL